MTDVTLTNSHVYVNKSSLTGEELSSLLSSLSYKDETVMHAINRARNSFYGAKQIPALQEKLYVHLYSIEEDTIKIPAGYRFLVPARLSVEDKRELPPFKTMLWFKKPGRELRYYQREAVDALKKDHRGQAVMATGSGKSFTMLNLVKETGLKTLIVCPSSIIANQLFSEFETAFGKKLVGMYGGGKKEIKQITVGLYQSVTKNVEAFKDFQMMIVDESQTLGASSLVAISRELSHIPYCYSLSATNWRADGKTPEIYAATGNIVYDFDTKRAISEGFLAQPKFIVRQVTSVGKEYDLKQKNYTDHVVKNIELTNRIVKDAQDALSNNMSTLILVQEIEHGNEIAARLNAQFANGENKDAMKLIDDMNKGRIKMLVAGAQMCGVGVDVTKVDCLIMASFPGTEGLTLQLLGRGLRKYEGKTRVIVLDYWPINSKMLGRHAENRTKWYKEYGEVSIIKPSGV
jgi:superfamily II DNA or RNA helicase